MILLCSVWHNMKFKCKIGRLAYVKMAQFSFVRYFCGFFHPTETRKVKTVSIAKNKLVQSIKYIFCIIRLLYLYVHCFHVNLFHSSICEWSIVSICFCLSSAFYFVKIHERKKKKQKMNSLLVNWKSIRSANDVFFLFSNFNWQGSEVEKICRSCNKIVFKMEEMKAEKSVWHRNCFRCSECRKPLRCVEEVFMFLILIVADVLISISLKNTIYF